MLLAQWDRYGHVCDIGEHVMTQSLTFIFKAALIYHTCMAML